MADAKRLGLGKAIARELGIDGQARSDAELAWLADCVPHADIQGTQDLQWVQSAVRMAEVTAAGSASEGDRAIFWIRLLGVLTNLDKHYRALAEPPSRWGAAEKERMASHPDFIALRQLLAALDDLRASLPEDELFYAEYRRHVESHPRQQLYRATLERPKAKTGRKPFLKPVTSTLLGDAREQHESDDTLRAVLLRYGFDQTRLATSVATRVLEPLRAVEIALTPLCTPSGGAR